MAKHPVRIEMEKVLKDLMVSHLRDLGYKGSFSHFRKIGHENIRLITFQLLSSGGSFVVELALCGPDGFTHSWGKHVESKKVTAHDIGHRYRLGSKGQGDHWFVYGKRNYEPGHDKVEPKSHYESIASDVLQCFQHESENYWVKMPNKSSNLTGAKNAPPS